MIQSNQNTTTLPELAGLQCMHSPQVCSFQIRILNSEALCCRVQSSSGIIMYDFTGCAKIGHQKLKFMILCLHTDLQPQEGDCFPMQQQLFLCLLAVCSLQGTRKGNRLVMVPVSFFLENGSIWNQNIHVHVCNEVWHTYSLQSLEKEQTFCLLTTSIYSNIQNCDTFLVYI